MPILVVMKTHRFIIILFIAGLMIFCVANFFMQKRFDVFTIAGACIYLVGVITGFIGYSLAKNKKKKEDLIDSLP